MKSIEEREEEIIRAMEIANASIKAHKDTLLFTSRKLITGKCKFYFSFFFPFKFKTADCLLMPLFPLVQ